MIKIRSLLSVLDVARLSYSKSSDRGFGDELRLKHAMNLDGLILLSQLEIINSKSVLSASIIL